MWIEWREIQARFHGVRTAARVGRSATLTGLVLLLLFGAAPGFLQVSIVSASNLCEETDRSEENSDGERIAGIQAQSIPSSGTSRFVHPLKNTRLHRCEQSRDQNPFSARELSPSLQPNPPPAPSHFFA